MTDSKTQAGAQKPPQKITIPEKKFFGRRKGNKLSARQQGLMDSLLPTLMVDVSGVGAGGLDLQTLFSRPMKEMWFEVGFGKGEHMKWHAERNSDVGFIGCEPYLNGVAGLLVDIEEGEIDNIRIYADDARHVMEALPDGCLDRFFLLQPDPWPKYKHARRRFVNPYNLDEIARLLKSGGEFRISTDDPVYRRWVNLQMCQRDDFIWQAEGPTDWRQRPDDWPVTRYVEKAIKGVATYFIYQRK